MLRRFACTTVVLFSGLLSGQTPGATPRFEIADIHTSANSQRDFARPVSVRNRRYELGNATMLDLIRIAWGFEADRILGGPNWLELDRFDVVAKVPPDTSADTQKLMLQALLKERFKLVAHEETKPIPSWALAVGKKPLMKEADGSGETGCKLQTGARQEGGGSFFIDLNGNRTQINMGPGGTLQYSCRNVTMADFAQGLGGMVGALINTPVTDQTGLKGKWTFDLKYSMAFVLPMAGAGERITLREAIEKLGLKLEEVPIPKGVLVVDKVERKPTENAPEVKEVLPEIRTPTEFEVADVKLAEAGGNGFPLPAGIRMQPGGRFVAEAMPLRFLVIRAFNVNYNDQIAGWPGWVDSVRVSITAKMPADYEAPPGIDYDVLAPLLKALLVERFGLAWHTEQRQGTAYRLVAAKPKLKKADPNSRIYCRQAPPSPGQAPGVQVLNCQNATMSMLAERLQNLGPINAPVDDGTGLEGGWDFTFSFNPLAQMTLALAAAAGRGGGGEPGGQIAAAASDPIGVSTIFESIEKQLGLKLEAQKKQVPVIVIDKLQQKPTDN